MQRSLRDAVFYPPYCWAPVHEKIVKEAGFVGLQVRYDMAAASYETKYEVSFRGKALTMNGPRIPEKAWGERTAASLRKLLAGK